MIFLNGFSWGDESATGVYRIPGTERSIRVRKEIAPLLIGFAAEFHARVEKIDAGILDDWGYAARPVRGSTSVLSMHGAGLAIDLNATRHVLGQRGTFNAGQVATIRALAAKYGLRWGGDFKLRADEMHYEVRLRRPEALALVKRLQAPPATSKAATPVVKPPSERPTTRRLEDGSRGANVKILQRRLAALGFSPGPVDGIYGSKTAGAVRRFQAGEGIAVDGIAGPVTLGRAFP